VKHFYFITGLPRSGSTLLSTLLSQNPSIYSSISSPLSGLFSSVLNPLLYQKGFETIYTENRRKNVLLGLLESFYKDIDKDIIFDTGRNWGTLSHVLSSIINTKMIVCVRDIPSILNSFEKLYQKQPLTISKIYDTINTSNVYTRTDGLMREDKTVGQSLIALKELLLNQHLPYLILEYDYFVKEPYKTMIAIEQFLNLPKFNYVFSNIENTFEDYDKSIGATSLHYIRNTISKEEKIVLPKDLIENYSNLEFWRGKEI